LESGDLCGLTIKLSLSLSLSPTGGGLYVCPPSALGEKKTEQDVQSVETAPKPKPVVEAEKESTHTAAIAQEDEPIQVGLTIPHGIAVSRCEPHLNVTVALVCLQMPAGWAAASLEMPMETTQDLWSMSRGDDVEPMEKSSEASTPTEQKQQSRLDAVALTYEPTLDASMSLAAPLIDACSAITPALVQPPHALPVAPSHLLCGPTTERHCSVRLLRHSGG
jgi:hypothetical protein